MHPKAHRKHFFKLLKYNEIAIFFSASKQPRNGDQFYFPFRQNSDFFYMTGIPTADNLLILYKNPDGQEKSMLFIYKPSEKEQWYEDGFISASEAKNISGVDYVYYLQDIDSDFYKDLLAISSRIYLCDRQMPLSPLLESVQQIFIREKVHAARPLMEKLRLKKSAEELQQIKRAISLTYEALIEVLPLIKPGTTEREIYGRLMGFYYGKHNCAPSFEPIVATGANAVVLHYTALKSELREGDTLLMDTGAEYNLYAGDITRVFPVSGKFSGQQLMVYEAVLSVQRAMIEIIKPGFTINELNEIAKDKIASQLVNLGILSAKEAHDGEAIKKFFPHGLSHFIGLDVHDCGGKDVVLEPGMVISCEPGIYIKDWGIGIRLEDDLLITTDGNINLSAFIPIDPGEIEKLMRRQK